MADKLRFAILHNGYIENDIAWNLSIPHSGDIYNKTPSAQWARFPFFSVLIDHPTLGYILYDTGCAPGDEKERFPKRSREMFPTYIQPEDFVDARLNSIGLSVNDISMIILSHMHFDHAGGLYFFQNTRAGKHIIVSRKDFAHGLVESHRRSQPPSFPYFKPNFEYDGLEFHFVDEDTKLAPDLELIALEGHAPTVLGLLLRMESGVYILPSDAVQLEANFGPPPAPPHPLGQLYDSLGYYRTVDKLAKLQWTERATIIYPHDPEAYKKLKKAPEFYE